MAFRALQDYLASLGDNFSYDMADVLRELHQLLADNISETRVFIPAMVTITKIYNEADALQLSTIKRFSQEAQDT